MSIIIAIIIGGIIGWLGARVMGRHEGIIASVVIGIIGAFIGNSLAKWIGNGSGSYLTFSWASLLWAFIGAIILSAILNAVQHRGRGVSQVR